MTLSTISDSESSTLDDVYSVDGAVLLQNRAAGKMARSGGDGSILPGGDFPAHDLYTREDWVDFRDPARISARAGVPRSQLPRAVVKELADNALDAAGGLTFGILTAPAGHFGLFVQDDGPGMDGGDEDIAARFSVRRPMQTSKTRRLPTRGMLGNGTRVVAGALLISGGTLDVCTRGRRLTLRPLEDGGTRVVASGPWGGSGTRVEIAFGPDNGVAVAAAGDDSLFDWVSEARGLTAGDHYKGKPSPWWYGPGAFWELLQAAGDKPLAREVEGLDGCTARAKVAAVVGDWGRRPAASLSRDEAAAVLGRARDQAAAVRPERLGKVGRRGDYGGYKLVTGTFEADGATIPFVVEAWANRADEPGVTMCVNRTPVLGHCALWRAASGAYVLDGCGFDCESVEAPAKRAGEFRVLVDIITPFVPLMSSGKDPDLSGMLAAVTEAVGKAVRTAQRACPAPGAGRGTQKALIETLIPEAAARLSDEWEHWFSLRQLFYDMRPALIKLLGREPSYGTFAKIVGKFEDREGDVRCLYRDDRGVLYVPHTRERVPLGTRAVAAYARPPWRFNRVLYSEKEGIFPILQNAGWPERWDCALLTSKGYATRAVLALLRRMAETGEPLTVFLIHDADGPGTMIYESLSRLAGPHRITVINLGLEPEEGRSMGLQAEPVRRKAGRVPAARYVPKADRAWLQKNRIELNAMTTRQLLGWLDRKVGAHGRARVVPPAPVVREHLAANVRASVERSLTAEAVREYRVRERTEAAMAALGHLIDQRATDLLLSLPERLQGTSRHWPDLVSEVAQAVAEGGDQ